MIIQNVNYSNDPFNCKTHLLFRSLYSFWLAICRLKTRVSASTSTQQFRPKRRPATNSSPLQTGVRESELPCFAWLPTGDRLLHLLQPSRGPKPAFNSSYCTDSACWTVILCEDITWGANLNVFNVFRAHGLCLEISIGQLSIAKKSIKPTNIRSLEDRVYFHLIYVFLSIDL